VVHRGDEQKHVTATDLEVPDANRYLIQLDGEEWREPRGSAHHTFEVGGDRLEYVGEEVDR